MAEWEHLAHTRALHLQQEYLEKSGHRDASLLPRRVPAVPDLRFEQSYLTSIRPYVHFERSLEGQTTADGKGKGKVVDIQVDAPVAAEVITIQWGRVAWITTRDQILSPLLQGTVRCVDIVNSFRAILFNETEGWRVSSSHLSSPRRAQSSARGGGRERSAQTGRRRKAKA